MFDNPGICTVRCVYQPIVALKDVPDAQFATIVGYEALARRIGADEAVDMTSAGANVELLDRDCRIAALRQAVLAGLSDTVTLFVNVEPSTADLAPRSAVERRVFDMARRHLRIVMEVTERALLDHPANVMRQVRWARQHGWGVAVDDIGANPDSLAMLPFIAPDVIKLDLSLVQRTPDSEQARTILAVLAHVERTGATLLAEGIETPRHLAQAQSFGASLGQGWYFGYPGPLPAQSAAGLRSAVERPASVPS